MSDPTSNAEQLRALIDVVCDGAPSENDVGEIERLLRGNPEAQRRYLAQIRLERWLRLEFAHAAQEPNTADAPPPEPVVLGAPLHGAIPSFSAGWPVAYLIATAIFAVGLAIGALVHVSQPGKVADQPSKINSDLQSPLAGRVSVVGRITGMLDCALDIAECSMQNAELQTQKADTDRSPFITQHSPIHLGDRIALRSGLLEITYDAGARVILQGPVTYEVESPAGGYLSIGKLAAKLEQKSEVRDQRSASVNQKSEIRNQKFVVRTPTALVTDLGTEFGVEVDKQGGTTSRVFRGSVRVQPLHSNGQAANEGRVLHENESARVDRQDGDRGSRRVTMGDAATSPIDFVREIPRPSIKTLDLVDVVAGGNGFSGRRNRGIDPITGRRVDTPPKAKTLIGDRRYHRAEGLPFVDGVFIPDNRRVPVQIDSAGHTFDAFGNAFNETSHDVWAGGPIPPDGSGRIIPTVLGGVDYASSGHGMLFMQANKGITFDLDAIRRANPSYKLTRFRTVVGNTETPAAMKAYLRTGATTFFSDDFQAATAGTMPTTASFKPGAATVGNWDVADSTGTSAQVVNNVDPTSNQAGSNHYLKIVRSGPDDRVLAAGWNGGETEGQIVQMSASVWVSSGSNAMAYLDGHASLAFDGRSFTVYLGADGSVKFYDGTAFVTTGLVSHPDTWQNVVVTANMATHRFSIKLDDQPLYTGGVWLSGATRVAYLLIGREGPRGTVYFDNVQLGESNAPPEALLAEEGESNRGSADVWILVDGERRAGRRGNTGAAGAFPLTIPIGQNDRFLTLAATDGGDGLFWDWILFGDPSLEMTPAVVQHDQETKIQ